MIKIDGDTFWTTFLWMFIFGTVFFGAFIKLVQLQIGWAGTFFLLNLVILYAWIKTLK